MKQYSKAGGSNYFFWFDITSEETREDVIYWIDWDGNLMIDQNGNYVIFWS